MNIKLFITTLFCVITLQVVAQSERKPNIIVILSDDAGYADFGCYGGKEIPTPNIDALAKNGVRFTNAYVTAAVCAPSRAGLLSGRYQQRFGFEHNTSSKPVNGFQLTDVGLNPSVKTIGNQMQANGYKTIAIGKWHLGEEEKHFPLNRGFDEFYGFIGGHRNFFAYNKQPKRELQLLHNRKAVPEGEVYYLTDMFTDKAISFVKENQKNPFFMYLAYNAVHTPINAQQELMQQFAHIQNAERRAYAAMMTSLDRNIGKLVATLKEQKLYENTLIVFLNDNGAATNNAADNGVLRGLKGSKWEGGIRVAYIMQWPAKLSANQVYHPIVSAMDITPTAIAASEGKALKGQVLDGVNLLPYLSNPKKAVPHQDLFWRRGVAAALRSGDWKLIKTANNPLLLFNLKDDISEQNNLASTYPRKVKQLERKLQNWEQKMQQPHWVSDYGDDNQIKKHRMEVVGREMEIKYP